MSDYPGNLTTLIKMVVKRKRNAFTNDQLIMLCGGTNAQWGAHLLGARVACIIDRANRELREHDVQLLSGGVRSQEWSAVSNAEYHRAKAQYRLEHADANMRNAHTAMLDALAEPNISKKMKGEVQAWLELFIEDNSVKNLVTFKTWADELLKLLPKPEAHHGSV